MIRMYARGAVGKDIAFISSPEKRKVEAEENKRYAIKTMKNGICNPHGTMEKMFFTPFFSHRDSRK